MTTPHQILTQSKRILLVDWSGPEVPRAVCGAGFEVYSCSPGRFSSVEVVAERPADLEERDIFPPRNEGEPGFLVFRRIPARPEAIDIVCVYRPENEHAGIVANIVRPTGAKVLWLQPGVAATAARTLAEENGLTLVEGVDIAQAACAV